MLGPDVLLLPDTGEEFSSCLKTAALYSEHIVCLSSAAKRLVRTIFGENHEISEPTKRYLDAAKEHEVDFALLEREGILMRPSESDEAPPNAPSDDEREQVFTIILLSSYIRYEIAKKLVRAGKANASFLEQCGRNKAMRYSPPSLWHAFRDRISQIYAESSLSAEFRKRLKPEIIDRAVHDIYLKIVADNVDSEGIGILTYSDIFEQSLSEVRLYPSSFSLKQSEEYVKAQLEQHRRRAAGNKLAQTLLSRSLPRAHDLPLDDVLELRRRHKDEIGAFRVGLGEIAAQVGMTRPAEHDIVQIEQLIRNKVDPALEELKAAIRNTRVDMLKSLSSGKETAAGATVAAALSIVTHATTVSKLAASAIGMILFPALSALVSGHLEKKRAINASRWSLLLNVEKVG